MTWSLKSRPQVLARHIWDDFVFRNMNYSELAGKYNMSERNILRKMDLYMPPEIIPTQAEVEPNKDLQNIVLSLTRVDRDT